MPEGAHVAFGSTQVPTTSVNFLVPVVWTALEYLRSQFATGFSWYMLAHSQHDYLGVIQIADLGGAYAVSFLVAMVNGLFADALLALEGLYLSCIRSVLVYQQDEKHLQIRLHRKPGPGRGRRQFRPEAQHQLQHLAWNAALRRHDMRKLRILQEERS